MKKKTIRKMALSLALMKMLSFGSIASAKGEDTWYSFSDGKLTISNSKIETQLVSESSKYYMLGNRSMLYAGNSLDFVENANKTILNPIMWRNLQEKFPLKEFYSFEQAMDFYRIYLEIISRARANYMSTIDKIFVAFEGNENDFEGIFGHPMYINGEPNYKIFSSDPLSLTNYEGTMKFLKKTFVEIELERYSHSKEFLEAFSHGSNPSSKEIKDLFKLYEEKRKKYQTLYGIWNSLEDDYVNLALESANYPKHSVVKVPINILKK